MNREEKIWKIIDRYWKEDEMCKADLFDFAEEILALDDWISVEDGMEVPDDPCMLRNNNTILGYGYIWHNSTTGVYTMERNDGISLEVTHYQPIILPKE